MILQKANLIGLEKNGCQGLGMKERDLLPRRQERTFWDNENENFDCRDDYMTVLVKIHQILYLKE